MALQSPELLLTNIATSKFTFGSCNVINAVVEVSSAIGDECNLSFMFSNDYCQVCYGTTRMTLHWRHIADFHKVCNGTELHIKVNNWSDKRPLKKVPVKKYSSRSPSQISSVAKELSAALDQKNYTLLKKDLPECSGCEEVEPDLTI